MSYTALYRKFRPAEFGDVKGQDHIITTLQNQIKANRIKDMHIFSAVQEVREKQLGCENICESGKL